MTDEKLKKAVELVGAAFIAAEVYLNTTKGTGPSPPPPPPPPPTALSVTMSANPTSATTGQAVQFSATASGGTSPYSYHYSYGDGSSGDVAQHSYASAGSYVASVTVTDSVGATATASVSVTVTAPTQQNIVVQGVVMTESQTGLLNLRWGATGLTPSGPYNAHIVNVGTGAYADTLTFTSSSAGVGGPNNTPLPGHGTYSITVKDLTTGNTGSVQVTG
jgi:hypothetical protein